MVSVLTYLFFSSVTASPILYERDATIYGEGQDVAIDAPGVAYHPAYKGFPSKGVGSPQTGWPASFLANVLNPGQVPPGINPVQCASKEGSVPVILIPGTTATVYTNWAYMGPKLAEEGLCLYSFCHNPLVDAVTGKAIEKFGFMGNITESAYALSAFIDEVLALTGAEQVDLVGHSQGGGALPYYYLKNIMQGNKVRKQIGLAPSLGTSILGMNALLRLLSPGIGDLLNEEVAAKVNGESLIQQLASSTWMQDLHAGGLAVENVQYYNIATKYDEVVFPYSNGLVHESNRNITNIVLQDKCLLDFSDHPGLAFSENALQIVKNCLFDRDEPISCKFTAPLHF